VVGGGSNRGEKFIQVEFRPEKLIFHPVLGNIISYDGLFGNTKVARPVLSSNVFEWENPKPFKGFKPLKG